MDSYEYGVDPTPLMVTWACETPKIDSIDFEHRGFYGTLNGNYLYWNSKGTCLNGKCGNDDDLTYSKLWIDVPDGCE